MLWIRLRSTFNMIYSYTHAWHQWQIDFWVNNIDELQRTLEEHEWLSKLSASAILIEHHKLVERVAACPASSGCWLRALPYHLTSTRAPRSNISCLGSQALGVMRWEAQVDEPVVHPRQRIEPSPSRCMPPGSVLLRLQFRSLKLNLHWTHWLVQRTSGASD